MAELTAFSYTPGPSLLNVLDVRFKLMAMVLISLSSLRAGPLSLSAVTGLFVLLSLTGPSLARALGEMRFFLLLLLFVFMARLFGTEGTPLFECAGVVATREGALAGALVGWRLLVVAAAGFHFVTSTRMSEIKAGVEWYLKPLPFVPEKRVSVMMSLIVRFIPVVLGQMRQTLDAQRSRGVDNRKNPVYRMVKLAIPLFRRVFEDADRLAVAMESRCFDEHRTDPALRSSRADWVALVIVLSLSLLMIWR